MTEILGVAAGQHEGFLDLGNIGRLVRFHRPIVIALAKQNSGIIFRIIRKSRSLVALEVDQYRPLVIDNG